MSRKSEKKRLAKMYKTSPTQMIHMENLWGKPTKKLRKVM